MTQKSDYSIDKDATTLNLNVGGERNEETVLLYGITLS